MNTQNRITRKRVARVRSDRWEPAKPVAVLLALALAVTACSGGNDSGDAEREQTATTTADRNDSGAEEASGEAMSDADDAEVDMAAPDHGAPMERESIVDSDAAVPDRGFFEQDPNLEEDNTFEDYGIREFIDTEVDPLSTFALDVDTASYSIGRQWLREGVLPPAESVRVEEYVNSFEYDYPAPRDGLTILAEGGPSPFGIDNVIIQLGVQAEMVADDDRPDASLVFVVDTSGSMGRQGRLELVKTSLKRLVRELDRDDRVAIVTYSGGADILLEPTSVRLVDEINDAIDGLTPDGSTNLEAGLLTGYDLANDAFVEGGINRVILASDGVANVGMTDPDGLVDLIRQDADNGIQLVTVGVGMGNFNDVVMETLADDGDGFYAYVDTEAEADQLFSDDLISTLLTVAIDSKIQVEFDDEAVQSYRLLGFENRAVLDDDFRNDDVDAGELGAGHQVTAIYELELHRDLSGGDRLGTAMLRWEDPDSQDVVETRLELSMNQVEDRWDDASADFRLAATVAAFAEILRGSPFADDITLDQVLAEVEALGDNGDVGELAELIRRAADLS